MKKFIPVLLAVLISLNSFAQNAENVKDSTKNKNVQYAMNKFKYNWDLSLVVGTNAFMGEFVHHYKSPLDMFTFPYLDLNVQKWLTPVWSVGLGVNYSKFKTLYKEDNYNYFVKEDDKEYSKNPGWYVATGDMMGIYIKTSCHLAYLFEGYRERLFHPIAYFGGGFLFPINKMVYRPCGITFNAGILFNFQITKNFLLGLMMEGNLVSDNFEGRMCSPETPDLYNIQFDANQKFGINLTYRFGFVKTKNAVTGAEERVPWIPVTEAVNADQLAQDLAKAQQDAAQAQSELEKANAAAANAQKEAQAANASLAANQSAREDSLHKQIEQLQLALSNTQAELEKAKALATEKIVKEQSTKTIYERDTIGYWQIITFPIDKWVITNRERVNIMAAADMIRATPGINYVLTGYADMQTATAERNMYLSKQRAAAVLKVLVEDYGIPAERLSTDFKGGVDNLYFNDVECSRSVVIAPAK